MASKEEKEVDEKRKRKFATFSLGNLKISKQYHGGPQPLGSSNMCLYRGIVISLGKYEEICAHELS